MYEAQTYTALLERMLDRVPDTIDKREGSVIYDALAPAAAELANVYMDLEQMLTFAFGDTASGGYLDLRALDRGVTRRPAGVARRLGKFYDAADAGFDVPLGSRYAISGVVYIVRERLSPGHFELEAEAAGVAGNQQFGALLPLDYVAGLARAELTDILAPGTDEETDEDFRRRYLLAVREPAASGNAAHYRQWALEVPGVGAVKIVPLWDGPGTVKAIIADADRMPASFTLVGDVAAHIGTKRPIGAEVAVVSAEGLAVNVAATITLAPGYSLLAVQAAFIGLVEQYLRDIAFELTYVSYARLGTLLLGTPGVIDYAALTLNGGTSNAALAEDEVPVAGTIALGV